MYYFFYQPMQQKINFVGGKTYTFTLTDEVNLPATNGKIDIMVYLPKGYENSNKKYGVVYLFDGQNGFSCGTEKYPTPMCGGWDFDGAIELLQQSGHDGVIVVGIDNGTGADVRDSQLTMSTQFGPLTPLSQEGNFASGTLELLGDFIVSTLMPFVNSSFSTLTTMENTGIVGASSGGLAAFYLGLRDSNLYGYVGAFSPATGLFFLPSWHNFLSQVGVNKQQKMYICCGKNSTDMLENILYDATGEVTDTVHLEHLHELGGGASTCELAHLLVEHGYPQKNIVEHYVDGAIHNEGSWKKILLDFLPKSLGIK